MLQSAIELAERMPPLTFLAGVVCLLLGGHWLVEGSVSIARRLGMSTLLIGLTIVACGTSAPELFFNVSAALSGSGDLSFGNVVGSNIANIGLVLGVAAFLTPLAVHGSVIRRDLPLLLVASVAMLVLALLGFTRIATEDGSGAAGYTRIDGLIMFAGFLGVIALWAWSAIRGRAEVPVDVDEAAPRPIAMAASLFFLGLTGLVAGGRLAEIGAVGIAESLNLSPALIGLTIVAIATSLPEVVTAVIAARKGHADLAVGNVVGSNLFNILFVLGATATVGDVPLPGGRGWIDLGVMLGMTVLLIAFAMSNGRQVLRWQSFTLLAAWLAFMVGSVVYEMTGTG